MIRAIVVIDNRGGLANIQGIPWDLPSDKNYFREQTEGHEVLMGYSTYCEFVSPLPKRRNLVASSQKRSLRTGFEIIHDVKSFLSQTQDDVWIIGGAGLYASTLENVDELYITRLKTDFDCTKFFPDYQDDFKLISKSQTQIENNLNFNFEIWKRLPKQG